MTAQPLWTLDAMAQAMGGGARGRAADLNQRHLD
jgi:hypothetical protein